MCPQCSLPLFRTGLKGSIQENVEAIPLVHATRAKTGVIQHKEAIIADSKPAPINLFSLFILLLKLCLYQVFQKMDYLLSTIIKMLVIGESTLLMVKLYMIVFS